MTAHQWDYPRPFLEITVEPHHIDALAHTRNTHYVEWCIETAWAHTSALGLGAEAYQQLDRAMALTRAGSIAKRFACARMSRIARCASLSATSGPAAQPSPGNFQSS